MASTQKIRQRIRSIQNTVKITKVMEMIAASRMRRAQERALMARPYAEKMQAVLANLAAQLQAGDGLHPLLSKRPVNKIAIIHITSDRGLCGGLNINVNHLSGNFILSQDVEVGIIAVGKKGRDFMSRAERGIIAEFLGLGDKPSIEDVRAIARLVIDDYTNGSIDHVKVVYPKFVSTTMQEPTMEELLPVTPNPDLSGNVQYIYEPTAGDVLDQLLPRYVEMGIYHALLETIASEQSARMVAMRNATDNANEMIEDLTLEYNKARQNMITTELLEITGGVSALK